MCKVHTFVLLNYFIYVCIAEKDFKSNRIPVTFQRGQSHHNICVAIIDDDIKEGFEKFRLFLSITYSARALGVWIGYPNYADVVIRGILYSHNYVYIYACVIHIYIIRCAST